MNIILVREMKKVQSTVELTCTGWGKKVAD